MPCFGKPEPRKTMQTENSDRKLDGQLDNPGGNKSTGPTVEARPRTIQALPA